MDVTLRRAEEKTTGDVFNGKEGICDCEDASAAEQNMPLRQLSQEEGLSRGTLSRWRAEARAEGKLLPDGDADPEGWNARDKFAAVIGEPLERH